MILVLVIVQVSSGQPLVKDLEFTNVSLSNALELIFKEGNNPPHIIEDTTQNVKIDKLRLHNISWDTALRQVSNFYGYKVVKNQSKEWLIIKR